MTDRLKHSMAGYTAAGMQADRAHLNGTQADRIQADETQMNGTQADGTACTGCAERLAYTDRLYYQDSHLFAFGARVLSCMPSESRKGLYETVLDRTAFFPEGGGQPADTGWIGDAKVTDVRERNGVIIHYTDKEAAVWTAGHVEPADHDCCGADCADEAKDVAGAASDAGAGTVFCAVDAEQRLRRMQNHSGEHIVSGLVHSAYGFDNVGFHMGAGCMTLDFSGELSWEQLTEIERKANEAVRANLPVKVYFPDPETLRALEYRSKLELTENVRIVEIEGIDRCACCAPHVAMAGEIGIIKILNCARHRGGVRVEVVCGMDALEDYRLRQDSVTEISGLLSAKRNEVASAVEHLKTERDQLKFTCAGLETELAGLLAAGYPDSTEGNIAVFRNFSEPAARELVNRLMEKCTGMAAVFTAVAGGASYHYIIGSRAVDLRAKSKEINAAISGRGGGKPEMITGSAVASREDIEAYFNTAHFNTAGEAHCSTDNEAHCSTDNEAHCSTANGAHCSTDNGAHCSTDNEAHCSTVSGAHCNTRY